MIGSKRVSGGPRSGTFLRAPERLGREYGGGEPGQRGYRDVARRSRPDSRRVEDGLLIRGGFVWVSSASCFFVSWWGMVFVTAGLLLHEARTRVAASR